MMEKMYINLLGRCEKCDYLVTRPIRVEIDESDLSPCECPECHEGKVYFERLAVQHKRAAEQKKYEIDKPLLWIYRVILLLAILFAGAFLYVHVRLHEDHSSEEIRAAVKESSAMSPADILTAFHQEGIREEILSRALGASRFSLRRIRLSESRPTPAMEAAVKGLYADYLLLGRSNVLFAIRYWKNRQDPFGAYFNPLLEICPQTDSGTSS